MNFVAKIKTMNIFFLRKNYVSKTFTGWQFYHSALQTKWLWYWVFLDPPTVPPPGLQEVVKIQNKYSTKSTLSSLNSGATFGKGGLRNLLFLSFLFCFILIVLERTSITRDLLDCNLNFLLYIFIRSFTYLGRLSN